MTRTYKEYCEELKGRREEAFREAFREAFGEAFGEASDRGMAEV